MNKFISISELSRILNLVDSSKSKTRNYILRYWEKEFKQIKPKKINNRRYYSVKQVEIIKMINFLLKTKGLSISEVRKILNLKINKLDDSNSNSLKADYLIDYFKNKSKTLLNKLNRLKKNGKKDTLKS
jgi:DNA-binding transcriptional MerR regulator